MQFQSGLRALAGYSRILKSEWSFASSLIEGRTNERFEVAEAVGVQPPWDFVGSPSNAEAGSGHLDYSITLTARYVRTDASLLKCLSDPTVNLCIFSKMICDEREQPERLHMCHWQCMTRKSKARADAHAKRGPVTR